MREDCRFEIIFSDFRSSSLEEINYKLVLKGNSYTYLTFDMIKVRVLRLICVKCFINDYCCPFLNFLIVHPSCPPLPRMNKYICIIIFIFWINTQYHICCILIPMSHHLLIHPHTFFDNSSSHPLEISNLNWAFELFFAQKLRNFNSCEFE